MSSKLTYPPISKIAEKVDAYGHLRSKMFDGLMGVIPYNGLLHASNIDVKRYQYYKDNFSVKENDILLASYQKCGHHFLTKTCIEIVRANDGDNVHELYSTGDLGLTTAPLIDWYSCGAFDDNEINERIKLTDDMYPRFWFSHFPYNHLPIKTFHPNSKTIVIIRNPKDQVVSGTAFYNSIFRQFRDAKDDLFDIDKYLSYFVRGFLPSACYFDYYQSFWKIYNSNDNLMNILWIYYEEMIDFPMDNIKKIADFIYDNSNDKTINNITDDGYKQILERTTFQNMKKDVTENPQTFEFQNMFRSGKKNDWMNHFTEEQSYLVDETMYFKWAEYCRDIKYYQELMERFNPEYNKGYF